MYLCVVKDSFEESHLLVTHLFHKMSGCSEVVELVDLCMYVRLLRYAVYIVLLSFTYYYVPTNT